MPGFIASSIPTLLYGASVAGAVFLSLPASTRTFSSYIFDDAIFVNT